MRAREEEMGKPRMLVTGADGMVGSYAAHVFTDYEVLLTDVADGFRELDVRDPEAVMKTLLDIQPDVVLHLAAATDVDRCEQEPDWAYHTNAIGTQNVALACQATEATLVYISTAGVFGGQKPEAYTEFDTPSPANVYGHSKLAGEHVVTSLLRHYYIVRAGWMVGGGVRDKKFVGKIARLIAEGQNPIRVVNDKFGTPTYAKDLLHGIKTLIGTNYYGLYHMANRGYCSRYDIALVLRDLVGRPDILVEPVPSAQFPLPAPRARSEAMRNLKLALLGLDSMPRWQDALREYVEGELLAALGRERRG